MKISCLNSTIQRNNNFPVFSYKNLQILSHFFLELKGLLRSDQIELWVVPWDGIGLIGWCAAKAFCYCPAIISNRPRSQNILKERALNPEKDSRIKRPRSQVSLEKSSQNYKPLENWAKPNLPPDVTPHPSYCLGECIWRVCHLVKPEPARISCHSQQPKKVAKDRGEGGVNRGLI